MLTADELVEIMPSFKDRSAEFVDPINDAMREFSISDNPLREAAFIAQTAEESGEFRYMEEIASGEAYDDRADLGNTNPAAIAAAAAAGTTPGPYFKGRGPIEVTGYDNYVACGIALGLDLVANPELLAQPVAGCRSSGWYWSSRGLNDLADKGDMVLITRRINGGLNGYDSRMRYYRRAMAIFGDQE